MGATNLRKVGRNDRRPCGSEKKFKKCCEPLADAFAIRKEAGLLILCYDNCHDNRKFAAIGLESIERLIALAAGEKEKAQYRCD